MLHVEIERQAKKLPDANLATVSRRLSDDCNGSLVPI